MHFLTLETTRATFEKYPIPLFGGVESSLEFGILSIVCFFAEGARERFLNRCVQPHLGEIVTRGGLVGK